MRTVRAFKQFVLTESGLNPAAQFEHTKFRACSDENAAFWEKLNGLPRSKGVRASVDITDIDAATNLTDAEWEQLTTEFHALNQ